MRKRNTSQDSTLRAGEKPEALLVHIENVVSVHVARCAVFLSLNRSLAKTSLRCIVKTVWMTAAASGQRERDMLQSPQVRSRGSLESR